ncbi:hypothetical protein BJX66DRAFT_12730 [Aspergillus keveii]|uniref:Uncharacterized protein n=1 Tax=Aspergillus keveii TaxID=714993 RepID=A0ABR4GQX4_9EURO
MDPSQLQPQPQTGFRSRRSYPSLNQISVAPLTPRYPIDDDDDNSNESQQDYFTPRNESVETPTRTSYLSSYSVPGTPGVLSRTPSRSGSRVRHHTRSKSSTPIHLSDSSLHDQNANQPLHHHHHHSRSSASGRTKRPTAVRHQSADARDPEWMLRAGIALASSAREEKGQSWLVKRESSTSLVSESQKYEVDAISQSLRTSMGRRSRSGRSTPAAASSRSHTASRRNSRPDLSMTGLEMTMPSSSKRSSIHAGSRPRTPHTSDEPRSSLSLLPDFIDERVRAEMRDTMEQGDGGYDSAASDDWDPSSSEEDEEIDERELQRLTRERGFGLGRFVDRLVEWTLFGVDDWPLSSADPLNNGPLGPEEAHPDEPDELAARSIAELSDNDHDETRSQASDTTHEELPAERAGENGGWEDAGWFFRAMRRALISA